MRKLIPFVLVSLLLAVTSRADEMQKIKAVMYVGGCCHDYVKMPVILAEEIGKRANISIDIKPMTDAAAMAAEFKSPQFGQGYDVIIYSLCFGEKWKDGDYDAALKVCEAGKPAVFVHCSAHNYRPPRDTKAPDLLERRAIADAKWHAIVGMDSIVHDKYVGFSTVKVAENKDHPILKAFPDDWKTPGDEMYNTIKMMPTATRLLQATSPASGKTHTVAWINSYGPGKTRVFGTTLGHDMKTGAEPAYHQLLTSGILWVCGKLSEDGKPAQGYGK